MAVARKTKSTLRRAFKHPPVQQLPAEAHIQRLNAETPPANPPLETKPGRPTSRPNDPPATKGDTTMPNAPIDQAVEAVQAIGAWEPESINDVDEFLTELGNLYEALATTQANLAQRFGSDLPIGAPIVDHLAELASGAAALTDHANQGRSIFRSFHEAEFERLENPRPHEEMWDVSANR